MIRCLFILLLVVTLGARAENAVDTLTAAGVGEFTAAYQAWSGERFAAAAGIFRQASTNAAATATNFYWLGVAEFHRALQLQSVSAESPDAPAALDAAVTALNQAVKLDEQQAESYALLGTIYGMKINGSLLRAAWYGPRVAKCRSKALEFGAANPRVQYLLGVCQFHTAKKKAAWEETLATLLQAEKLFVAEAATAATALSPRWGGDSCLTFIGRTYERLGQLPEAANYFRKALALHPADHVAKAALQRIEQAK